jgi:acetyl esterase/lipase
MWVLTTRPELLHDQILRFVELVRAAGGDVTLREHPNLWHSGHTQVSMVREAADVVHAAGVYLRSHLTPASQHLESWEGEQVEQWG